MPDIPGRQLNIIDKLYWSPAERAQGIFNIINTVRVQLREENIERGFNPDKDIPSDWDILCFAIEYIGQMALGIQNDELMELAVGIGVWLQSVHYNNAPQLYGAPDKKHTGGVGVDIASGNADTSHPLAQAGSGEGGPAPNPLDVSPENRTHGEKDSQAHDEESEDG